MQPSERQIASACLLVLVNVYKYLVTDHSPVDVRVWVGKGVERVVRITDAWWSHAETAVSIAVT